MTLITTVLSLFLMAQSGLPKHFDTQDMELEPIAHGNKLTLEATFKIPDGFKNRGNATMNVYEKIDGNWRKVQTLKEDKLPLFRVNNTMEFNKTVMLTSADNDVALDFSVPFCNKICVINSFQGVAKRSKKIKNRQLHVHMKGFLPQDKVKKEFRVNRS